MAEKKIEDRVPKLMQVQITFTMVPDSLRGGSCNLCGQSGMTNLYSRPGKSLASICEACVEGSPIKEIDDPTYEDPKGKSKGKGGK